MRRPGIWSVALASVIALPLWPSPSAPAAPLVAREGLADIVGRYSVALGAPIDPVSAPAVPAEVASPLTAVLERLLECHHVSQSALATGAPEASADAIRQCADSVVTALGALETSVGMAIAGAALPHMDLWPVVRIEPGNEANEYHHDYALIVDAGGDDLYDNNAGSNVMDLKRGPAGSHALEDGQEARGCEGVGVFNVRTAGVNEFSAQECSVSAAALLDMAGNDRYGVLESTGERDQPCTDSMLVRRVLTEGAGLAGVGVLRDVSGNDRYLGKVMSQGVGHLGGVGILSEGGGDDLYLAIRESQGFSLLGSLGSLRDHGGNDVYDIYMPTGGLLRDSGACDDQPQNTLGAAFLGGAGIAVDEGGDDSYRVAGSGSQQAGLGAGAAGGVGSFTDLEGDDTYQGAAGRGNGVTLLPTHDGFGGVGLFIDR